VHLQYWNTRIVDLFTIPEAPVVFIHTSIADTGRFWKILVIPVLQILED
jgi:hypothetical protein